MSTARLAALQALERCRRDGAWSAQTMDRVISSGELNRQDASLAARLFLGVLQNSSYLDYYIDLVRGSGKLEPKLRDILRIGAYQLFFLEKIPVHAAVNESVSLCRACGYDRAAGLVNAVLRRLSGMRGSLPEIPGFGTPDFLSTRYTQEKWLSERLVAQNGFDFCEAFFQACNQPPSTDLQVNTMKCSFADFRKTLAESGISYTVLPFPKNCVSVSGGRITELPGFDDGFFYVQDRAAAMALEIAQPRPGIRVLDACAAPGGKSFAAAIRMEGRGKIVACDIHEKKLALIRSGAARLGIPCIDTAPQNACVYREEWSGAFDLVIADVPCSGFGVIRKKPEIRHKAEEEVSRLPEIQQAILNNVSQYVKPGGTLLYSTCTVLKEENEEVVNTFLRRHPAYVPVDFNVESRSSKEGYYTFWPQIDGSDGFFIAKFKRIEQ